MNKPIANLLYGIKINITANNKLRYADDTVLIAYTLQDCYSLVNEVVYFSEEYGLLLKIYETKCYHTSRIEVTSIYEIRKFKE